MNSDFFHCRTAMWLKHATIYCFHNQYLFVVYSYREQNINFHLNNQIILDKCPQRNGTTQKIGLLRAGVQLKVETNIERSFTTMWWAQCLCMQSSVRVNFLFFQFSLRMSFDASSEHWTTFFHKSLKCSLCLLIFSESLLLCTTSGSQIASIKAPWLSGSLHLALSSWFLQSFFYLCLLTSHDYRFSLWIAVLPPSFGRISMTILISLEVLVFPLV